MAARPLRQLDMPRQAVVRLDDGTGLHAYPYY
jgi:hypothetical protein